MDLPRLDLQPRRFVRAVQRSRAYNPGRDFFPRGRGVFSETYIIYSPSDHSL